MESLIVLAVLMSVAYRLVDIIITAFIVIAAVIFTISIIWGVYDRIKGKKVE